MNPLPIDAHRNEVLEALQQHNRVVLQGPTGSGKSTRVPPWVAEHLAGKILILQPRRLAARMLARRVAQEQQTALGEGVGYRIRFENKAGPHTPVVYCTEGVLLRMLVDDPALSGVAAVIFDEFHERHLFTDVSLARMLQLQAGLRPDLKLIVMSATLDLPGLQEQLSPCASVSAKGRTFPVDVEHLPPSRVRRNGRDVPVWDLAAEALKDALDHNVEGDVLVFMPGGYEIRKTMEAIRGRCRGESLDIRALHGQLSADDQDRALDQASKRRVIVSTNIAETSVTIDGIRLVIDSGLARQSRFDPSHGINRLEIVPISQASAEQRRGRAGRTAPGLCLRLWSEKDHRRRAEHELPEIHRLELSEIALGLKASGETNLSAFPWFEAPRDQAVEQAEQLLHDLGATDANGALTDLGRQLLRFPVHPRFGRMLIEAGPRHCLREMALMAALVQGRPLFTRRKPTREEQQLRLKELALGDDTPSDFELLARAWSFAHRNKYDPMACGRLGIHGVAAREAGRLRSQFIDAAERLGIAANAYPASWEDVSRCLLTGLSDRVAVRLDRGTLRCRLVGGRVAELTRESLVHDAGLLLAGEVTGIGQSDGKERVLINHATEILPEWLEELFPEDLHEGHETRWDSSQRRVVSSQRRCFRDLVLQEKEQGVPDPDQAAAVLAGLVEEGALMVKSWDTSVDAWIARVNVVATALPEWGVPVITDADRSAILEQALYGLTSAKQVKNAQVQPVLNEWLSAEQRAAVEHAAPLRMDLPRGKRAKVRYGTDGVPVLAATVQQLYDLERPLIICDGRVKLRVEILGPNRRPVHITDDLSEFWGEAYERVKKDLKGRYPRHEWR